jgi:O-antigen ligase
MLPFAYIPSLRAGQSTSLGTLEPSDFVMVPLFFFLLLDRDKTASRNQSNLGKLLLVFFLWALTSTLLINVRYPYFGDFTAMWFGLAKLAKLILYAGSGLIIAHKLRIPSLRARFNWCLLGCLVILAVGIILSPAAAASSRNQALAAKNNALSVAVAVFCAYLAGLLLARVEARRWKFWAIVALFIGVLGGLVSQGRGGWLALAAAVFYLLWVTKRRGLAIGLFAGFITIAALSYLFIHPVRQRVEDSLTTHWKKEDSSSEIAVGGLRDGERIAIWKGNFPRLAENPILGSGFYHRGGFTHVPWWGAHNYFLQMGLETGIPGGMMILFAFYVMWANAGTPTVRSAGLTLGLRAAIIAAIVGNMGGEYYYGGPALLGFFLVYAPAGGLLQQVVKRRFVMVPIHRYLPQKRGQLLAEVPLAVYPKRRES